MTAKEVTSSLLTLGLALSYESADGTQRVGPALDEGLELGQERKRCPEGPFARSKLQVRQGGHSRRPLSLLQR